MSPCCNVSLVFQHPQTKLFVTVHPEDPTYAKFVRRGGVPRCRKCNRPVE